ncbi:MAG: hypothetical protein DRJ01_14260 [Bacteroidetes bacterium]|nr:MAG: hypothetical protein DRJ01_14260 [Bacteroidota bacterium]
MNDKINKLWFKNQIKKGNIEARMTQRLSDDYAYDNEVAKKLPTEWTTVKWDNEKNEGVAKWKDFTETFDNHTLNGMRIYGDKNGIIEGHFASWWAFEFRVKGKKPNDNTEKTDKQKYETLNLTKLPEDVVKALNMLKDNSDDFQNLSDIDKGYFDKIFTGIQKDYPEAVKVESGKKELSYKGFNVAGYNGDRKSTNYEDYKGYKLVQYDVNEVDIVDKDNKAIEVVSSIERAKQFVDELQAAPPDLQKDLADLQELYKLTKNKSLKRDIEDLEMLIGLQDK